jgi:hypothetical protein
VSINADVVRPMRFRMSLPLNENRWSLLNYLKHLGSFNNFQSLSSKALRLMLSCEVLKIAFPFFTRIT